MESLCSERKPEICSTDLERSTSCLLFLLSPLWGRGRRRGHHHGRRGHHHGRRGHHHDRRRLGRRGLLLRDHRAPLLLHSALAFAVLALITKEALLVRRLVVFHAGRVLPAATRARWAHNGSSGGGGSGGVRSVLSTVVMAGVVDHAVLRYRGLGCSSLHSTALAGFAVSAEETPGSRRFIVRHGTVMAKPLPLTPGAKNLLIRGCGGLLCEHLVCAFL
jgi:hypothetical protein